ncbi:MAG: ATP-binding cassette domain-containing protein, partial [Firmicutes bacterium]|nr:ATP-binding cassette domain-containing protein [Bacillota bacterium]
METLLHIDQVASGYDNMQILWQPELFVAHGECILILGSNGVGKTTLLKAIVGLLPIWKGSIHFDGSEITHQAVDKRIRGGISYVSEIGIIDSLTVEDNLRLGGYYRAARERKESLRDMYDRFPILAGNRRGLAGSLSGGQRKVLSTAKALMSR